MTKARQEEIILKALKCYQKELTNQISFHNAIGKTASIHRSLIDELYRVEDVLDPLEKKHKKPIRTSRK